MARKQPRRCRAANSSGRKRKQRARGYGRAERTAGGEPSCRRKMLWSWTVALKGTFYFQEQFWLEHWITWDPLGKSKEKVSMDNPSNGTSLSAGAVNADVTSLWSLFQGIMLGQGQEWRSLWWAVTFFIDVIYFQLIWAASLSLYVMTH